MRDELGQQEQAGGRVKDEPPREARTVDDLAHDGVGAGAVARSTDDAAVGRLVRTVLRIGLIAGAALLVAGFILWAARGGTLPASVDGPVAALQAIGRLDPVGFFSLGLLVIILTPFVRVAGTVVIFFKGREWTYVAVTAGVLLSMIAGLLVGAL